MLIGAAARPLPVERLAAHLGRGLARWSRFQWRVTSQRQCWASPGSSTEPGDGPPAALVVGVEQVDGDAARCADRFFGSLVALRARVPQRRLPEPQVSGKGIQVALLARRTPLDRARGHRAGAVRPPADPAPPARRSPPRCGRRAAPRFPPPRCAAEWPGRSRRPRRSRTPGPRGPPAPGRRRTAHAHQGLRAGTA